MLGEREAVDITHLDEAKRLLGAARPHGTAACVHGTMSLREPKFEVHDQAMIRGAHQTTSVEENTSRRDVYRAAW